MKMVRCVLLALMGVLAGQGFPEPFRVLNPEAKSVKGDVKVELGEGYGETHDAALQDALRDVLQKVVGVYVDSDFRMNNDEIIKDQIIMHSNGLIEKYTVIDEADDENGRGKIVTIRARVKIHEVFNRIKKIAPTQTVAVDGALVANEIGNQLNAEKLLRKEFENLDLKSLMEIKMLDSIHPERQPSKGDSVVMRYAFVVQYSQEYHKRFLPRLNQVLNQIAKGEPKVVPIGAQYNDRVRPMIGVGEENFVPYVYNKQRYSFNEWKGHHVSGVGYKVVAGYMESFRLKFFRKVASVIWKITSDGEIKVKTWPLDDYLLNAFLELRDNLAEQFKSLRSELRVLDQSGNVLSCSEAPLPFWDSLDDCNIAPFLCVIRANIQAKGYDPFHGYLQYVGCIDVAIRQEDLPKIKSVQFRLKNEGEED